MPTSVWCKKSVVDIHQIYTRLSWVKEEQTPTGTTQSELKHYSDLFTANKNGVIPKRILVQGQTGIGKSTFVKKLLVDWVEVNKAAGDEQAAVLKNFELVVAVNLKEVSKCQSLKDVIRLSSVFAKEDKCMTENLVDYISNNQEKVLLIFDGYDEYRSGCDSEIYEIFSGNSLRSCCVLITTRISKADELRGSEDLHAEITGFSRVDREDFMRRFLNSEEVSKLKNHLHLRRLQELAKVPLLLLLFCILWREGQSKSFPNSKTKLYVDIVQFVLNHSHSKQTADKTKTKQYVELKSFKEILSEIGKVALQSLLNDDHLFEYSQLSDSVRCDDSVFIGLLQITEYSETLRPTGMVSFIHKSIQEFLAAWYVTYRCIAEGRNLGEIGVKLEKCWDLRNVFQFICGLSEDGALAALRYFKSVRISDPSLDLSKAIPHGGNKTDVPLNEVTARQHNFNDMVLNLFEEAESKAELSQVCLDCLGSVLISPTRSFPKELLIKAKDTNSLSLIIGKVGKSLNKIVKILVRKSSKTFNAADFFEKFENSSRLSTCHCCFSGILCFRNGQVYFYITDLQLWCLPHVRLFTDKVNFSVLSSALNFLRDLDFSLTEYFTDSICHLLKQVSNPHRCILSIGGCSLTSKGAVEFAFLLSRFQKVTRLDLHLAECSAEAVSKLFAAIKHESLLKLILRGITLTPAVVESLSQSLPELTTLQTLQMKGASGCNLSVDIPLERSSFGTLTIADLTENAAKAITRLFDFFKYKRLDKVELSVIKLTSTLADAVGQLLPELSTLRRLSIVSLNECPDEAATKLVAPIKHKNLEKLGDEAATKLVAAIKHKTLEILELRKINLTSAAAEALGQLLPELSALRTLSLGSLTECSDEAVTKLVASIKHTNLDQLYLHGINLTSAVAEALGQLLPELSALRTLSLGFLTECSDEAVTKLVASFKHKNLDQLYLHGINLTSAAAEALGQLLPELSALRTLSLGFLTECSDEAVTKLVASFKHKNLDQLYLHGINLTSAAAEALGQVLPELSALQTLSLGFWTESSDEAVTKLVASIKHKNLDQLYLLVINPMPAVAQALGQLLREPSSLQVLELCFSDGCTMWLSFQTLEIHGLSESSADVVLSLIEVIKNQTIKKLELSNIALKSAAAGALAQLLTELLTLRTLNTGASTECSDEAVTRSVATTKHETLEELYLPEINLTPAVAKALGQSLPELSSLRKLTISGSDGCSLQHKELEALFGRFNRPSSLIELSVAHFSARGSLGSIANNLCFFPSLRELKLEDLDMGEADLSDLLENLKFTPDLRGLYLRGNPLGHAVRSVIPYLIEQQKLELLYFRRGDCSEEDLKYVQEAVKEKRPGLNIRKLRY